MADSKSLVVVIRTAGERTLELCRDLVLKQIPKECLQIVNEFPFEAALRRCYEIGIESGAEWMMTLDADVLLREGTIQEYFSEVEGLPEDYFEVTGLLYDKFLGLYRSVGHRMYRTKYLQIALQQIPRPREAIRPEYTTVIRMEGLGYRSLQLGNVFGIHDYEQFYGDVYRKAFVHAVKHSKRIPHFIEGWKQAAAQDDDFRVAIKGLYDGLMFTGTTAIDKRDFIEKAKNALQDMGLLEKSQFVSCEADSNLVDSVLMRAGPVPEERLPGMRATRKLTRLQRLKEEFAHLGAARFSIYSLGAVLTRVGELLKQNASTAKIQRPR